MQVRNRVGSDGLRPSRLNFAGWCMYCIALGCTDARCIALHAASSWTLCTICQGSEYSDRETMTRCECVGGLIEADGPDAEVIDLLSFVVTCPARPADEPRNGASGLVPRGPAVEPYKYPPLTPKTPELGAIAKANPNDAAAQWAAYGVQY